MLITTGAQRVKHVTLPISVSVGGAKPTLCSSDHLNVFSR